MAAVVVPWLPGDLVVFGGDERDDVVDELFPADDGGPGPFDVALVAGGLVLSAWAWRSGSGGLLVLGAVVAVLGCLIPARTALRAFARRRAMAAGLLLDVSDRSVADLVTAYRELRGVSRSEDALGAGHRAVVEVASLLRAAPPATIAERGYVATRTTAIRELVALLRVTEDRYDERNASVRGREAVDATSPFNSLRDIAAVTERLRGGDGR